MSIFKAYDIRGPYGEELTPELAYKIGRCLPTLLSGKKALVGNDMRFSSLALREALSQGLADAGCDADLLGLSSTPMVYYFTAKRDYDFSVQITASHNPQNHNGFKISRRGSLPVGYASGLAQLEEMVRGELGPKVGTKGRIRHVDYIEEFVDFLRPYVPDISGLNLTVDCSDGMASLSIKALLGDSVRYVAEIPDGSFPSHSPNPLEKDGQTLIVKSLLEHKADAGLIFDGDADRVMFFDEEARFVRPDIMIAPMAEYFLEQFPGSPILQDIRTSRAVTRRLLELGARPEMWKVGHAFAKVKLRELNAPFGGELAGHYYFRDFFFCDSGELASLIALGQIARAKRAGLSFSEQIAPLAGYPNTGELNYQISDKDAAIERIKTSLIKERVPDALLDFDGYRIEYKDWWVSIRKSNTEPYLRLIIEAESVDMLLERKAQIEKLLSMESQPGECVCQ